jgi:hypothetical protein
VGLAHRDSRPDAVEATGWKTFVRGCSARLVLDGQRPLDTFEEDHTLMVRGQDGWAFQLAIRFQYIAHDLEKEDNQYIWSGYELMWRLIAKTRDNVTMLDAVEAIELCKPHQDVVVEQFQRLGIWP